MTLSGGLGPPNSQDYPNSNNAALVFFSPPKSPNKTPTKKVASLTKDEVAEMDLSSGYAKIVAELILKNATNQTASIFQGCVVAVPRKEDFEF
jgi:hypothetical protein